MGRPIKWASPPNKQHEATAKEACGNYEKLKVDIAEKEKMLVEIKKEQAAAISNLERGIKEELYAECKRAYDRQSAQLKTMELALSKIADGNARTAVRQFYFEHVPLKSMKDFNGCLFGKSRADYYKGKGFKEFVVNLENEGFFRKNSS